MEKLHVENRTQIYHNYAYDERALFDLWTEIL